MTKTYKIADRIKLYELGTNMNIKAAEVAYKAMKG